MLLLLLLAYGDDCCPQWLCAGSTVTDRMRFGREMRTLRSRVLRLSRKVYARRAAYAIRWSVVCAWGCSEYREGEIEYTALEEHRVHKVQWDSRVDGWTELRSNGSNRDRGKRTGRRGWLGPLWKLGPY